MFGENEIELDRLHEALDRDRRLIERAEKLEEAAQKLPQNFCMTDLYAVIPDNDYGPIKISDFR